MLRYELTLENPDKAKQILDMLLEYHSQKAALDSGRT